MNINRLKSVFQELKGDARQRWTEFTQQDVSEAIGGGVEKLVGRIRRRSAKSSSYRAGRAGRAGDKVRKKGEVQKKKAA